MNHKARFVNIIDLILRGECPVDIRLKILTLKIEYYA